MEKAQTFRQALVKGKGKFCTADRCSQKSQNVCERCFQPACKYHMCARVKNKKKIKICDKCNYSEVKDQIELENQKDKKQALDKLQSVNEKNSEAYDEALQDKQRIRELEEKVEQLESTNNLKNELKVEEISKEQYLKENNIEMLANLKAAIENSTKNFTAENEKLAQIKQEASSFQIDINQMHSKIRELENSIKGFKDQVSTSITHDQVNRILCQKCLNQYRGISVLKSVNDNKGKKKDLGEGEACSKCVVC